MWCRRHAMLRERDELGKQGFACTGEAIEEEGVRVLAAVRAARNAREARRTSRTTSC